MFMGNGLTTDLFCWCLFSVELAMEIPWHFEFEQQHRGCSRHKFKDCIAAIGGYKR